MHSVVWVLMILVTSARLRYVIDELFILWKSRGQQETSEVRDAVGIITVLDCC